MIREVILGAGAIYVVILVIQLLQKPSSELGAVIAASVLALATVLYWDGNHHRIHTWELVALWSVVILFLVYGLLKYTGVL